MKESFDNVEDVKFDCALILLIEEGGDAIWARSFVGTQLEHNELYFFIGDWSIEKRKLLSR